MSVYGFVSVLVILGFIGFLGCSFVCNGGFEIFCSFLRVFVMVRIRIFV